VVAEVELIPVLEAWGRCSNKSLPDAMRLPLAGGWTDQPPLFITCMDIMSEEARLFLSPKE